MPGSLLALRKLEVAYGGIQAVKGIDLHVEQGELVCLIGANGAGKTTTLKGICGLLPVKSGTIHYAGEDVTGRPAFTLVQRGLEAAEVLAREEPVPGAPLSPQRA